MQPTDTEPDSRRVKSGLRLFSPGTPRWVKVRNSLWAAAFILVVLFEAFYWLFGNQVEPIILGLPFGMFLVTSGIIVAFVLGLVLFLQDEESPTSNASNHDH